MQFPCSILLALTVVKRGTNLDAFTEGLRCQDVHAGLRNLNQNSGRLSDLADTQRVGMAASLAALIRGQDVVTDAQALKSLAAEQLDVSPFAFDDVVLLLEDVGFVSGVKRSGSRITGFDENVPYYDNLYNELGKAWRDRSPSEVEEQLVALVNHLATGPAALEELDQDLDLDSASVPDLLEIGLSADLVKRIDLIDGTVLYSPFFGFENPQLISDLVQEHGSSQLADAFALVRGEQGTPVDGAQPVLLDAVSRGLLLAPSVEIPGGATMPFATLPYSLDRQLLLGRKPVLEKALAVIACLRCGQYFGGATNLTRAALVRVLDKLLDPFRGYLEPHGSHERQYQLMYRAGLLAFAPDTRPGGRWVTPTFVDTPDNREALKLARDLLTHGEQVAGRIGDEEARKILATGSPFLAPMQTIAGIKPKVPVKQKDWQKVIDAAMGRGRL